MAEAKTRSDCEELMGTNSSNFIICGMCQQKRNHRARGLCLECYEKLPRKIIRCLECGENKEHKGRNLCGDCYKASKSIYPAVPRNVQPSTSEIREKELEELDRKRKLPEHPTQHQPGSEEKIVEMVKRHERNELLHHPQDNKTPLPPTRQHNFRTEQPDAWIYRVPGWYQSDNSSIDF